MNVIGLNYKGLSVTSVISLMTFLSLVLIGTSCDDASQGGGDSSATIELLTGAEPDECWCGLGDPDSGPIPESENCDDVIDNPENDDEMDTVAGCIGKVNQLYIWSLAKVGSTLWMGTVANTRCLGQSGAGLLTGMVPEPFFNEEEGAVCEFEKSTLGPTTGIDKVDENLGDHRPPRIFTYDTNTGVTEEKFVDNCAGIDGTGLLMNTFGLRSAGSGIDKDGRKIVFLAGPTLVQVTDIGDADIDTGINIFAFDADSGDCIGAKNFPEWNDIRKWLLVDGILYTAVGETRGGGFVLRWVGDLDDPFEFEIVGKLGSDGANIALHKGRIFVTTWPNLTSVPFESIFSIDVENPLPELERASLYMSPIVPPGGLTSGDSEKWEKVWDITEYEPDPIVALTYGLGDLRSFGDHLYWGTMQVPFTPVSVFSVLFGIKGIEFPDFTDLFLNTKRATSVFRGRDFDSVPEIEVLYGESTFPVFDFSVGDWVDEPNVGAKVPLFGPSGLGNPFGIYAWTMAVFDNKLYVGIFDSGGIAFSFPPFFPPTPLGADLWRFDDAESPAELISDDGFGSTAISGIRTMLSDEDGEDGDDALYMGTAGGKNLEEPPSPKGGWSLLGLR
jgi:hypothetical protein